MFEILLFNFDANITAVLVESLKDVDDLLAWDDNDRLSVPLKVSDRDQVI